MQQVSRGSAHTVGVSEPPLQNSTVIGGSQSNRPGLTEDRPHAMYVPPTELADKRQATALRSDSTLKNPYSQLGPREWTNLPSSEVPMIDVQTATAMRKVQIRPFVVAMRKWNWWRHDYVVAMMGVGIPQNQWVAVLPIIWMIRHEMRMKN